MVTNVPISEHGTPLTAGDRGIADPRYAETVYTPGRIVHPHWGAIIVGLFVTLSTMALLSVLGVAIGASSYDPYAPGHDARAWGIGAGIWTLVMMILAYGTGGYAASWTSTYNWSKKGMFHGFMVWAVAVPVLGLLLSSGLAGLAAGANNTNPNDRNAMMNTLTGGQTNNAGQTNANAGNANNNANDNVTPQDVKNASMATAWWAFISMVLSLGAAMIGGAMGAKTPKTAEGMRRDVAATTPAKPA